MNRSTTSFSMEKRNNTFEWRENITLGSLKHRNKVYRRFIKNQLAPHRQAVGEKSTMASPFINKWPRISREVQQNVMEKIKIALAPMKEDVTRGGRKKREREKAEAEAFDDFTEHLRREQQSTKDKKRDEIRKCLIFGINETTRCLERGEISCLLVCSRTNDICPNNHLQTLAATRECPAMMVRDFSLNVGRSLGMNSVLTLAIKKTPPAPFVEWVGELVKLIVDSAKPLHVQWVQFDELEGTEEVDNPSSETQYETDPKATPSTIKSEETTDNTKSETARNTKDNNVVFKSEPFDINSLYIRKVDSDWLKDETKILPIIRASKSVVSQDFIKLDSHPRKIEQKFVENDPFMSAISVEEPQKKKKRSSVVGYLPPHVYRVPRDENRKKRLEKRKKKNKTS